VVIACLLVAKEHLGDEIRIGTDAESPDAWEPGEALYRKAFGREPRMAWLGDEEGEAASSTEDSDRPDESWGVFCPACSKLVGQLPRKDEPAAWRSLLAHVEAVHPEGKDDLYAWVWEQEERRTAEWARSKGWIPGR